MGLITTFKSRVKAAKAAAKTKLTYQQEQLFGLHLSNNGIVDFNKTPHGIYYNLLGCPRGKKSYYNYDCNFQKNPETLVILLLLPLIMGRIGLLYACIIYQYPLHTIFDWAKKWFLIGCSHVASIGGRLYKSLDKCETSFVNMNLYTMVNQMVFFMVCDRAAGFEDKERITSLYSLLFYNVLTYCFSYVKEVVEKENWDMSVSLTPTCQIRHLAMSTTKLVLEWIKAVTFIVTVVCMLLVLGLEQGLEHYSPTKFYILVTLTYYILTEKLIQEAMPNVLLHIPIRSISDQLNGLEQLASNFLIKNFITGLNIVMLFFNFPCVKIALVTLYFNVWLQYKSSIKIKSELKKEIELVSKFRGATEEELLEHDDVCPICLNPLDYAKVTPCQHFFHTNCLRLCLKSDNLNCPMCKREFKFE